MRILIGERARADLASILAYSAERFGSQQALLYRGKLENGFETLRTFPFIGIANRLPSGYQAFQVAHHWVCYEVRDEVIYVDGIVQRLADYEHRR